ncbi:MAG: hypothetical protein P8Z81_14990 [Deinococcales bacterium]
MEQALTLAQAVLAAGLIVVGGIVEGYGYGLSLGTNWPYTRNIAVLAGRGDPEAWHRIIATLLGLNALVLVALHRGGLQWTGLGLIVFTALLGMATLFVLAGKAPSWLQGLHGLLAYSTLFTYLLALSHGPSLGTYLETTIPLHSFLLVIFMGGVVTGQRGFARAIGSFTVPRTLSQWVWVVHGLAVLLFLLTLAYETPANNVALLFLLAQVGLGFLTFQAVNARARRPGVLVPFHQLLSVGIALALFYHLQVRVPWLG